MTSHSVPREDLPAEDKCQTWSYGFPGIRALSKLGQKTMQSTLSKKDGLVVSETCLDPVLELISGAVSRTLVFYSNRTAGTMPTATAVSLDRGVQSPNAVYATCSPYVLSQIPDMELRRFAAANGVGFLTCHVGCNLDDDESMAVVEVLLFVSAQPKRTNNILSLFKHWITGAKDSSDFNGRILPVMHGSWYSKRILRLLSDSVDGTFVVPATMFEHCFLGNYDTMMGLTKEYH
jgi:hypothetical protein